MPLGAACCLGYAYASAVSVCVRVVDHGRLHFGRGAEGEFRRRFGDGFCHNSFAIWQDIYMICGANLGDND